MALALRALRLRLRVHLQLLLRCAGHIQRKGGANGGDESELNRTHPVRGPAGASRCTRACKTAPAVLWQPRISTAQTPCLARMVGAGTNDCGCPTEPVRQNDFTRCVWRVVSQIRKFPKNPFTFSVFLTGFVHFGGNFRRKPPPEVCAPQPPSLLFRLGPSAIARNLCSSPLMRRARRRITDSSTALRYREYIHGKWTRPAA